MKKWTNFDLDKSISSASNTNSSSSKSRRKVNAKIEPKATKTGKPINLNFFTALEPKTKPDLAVHPKKLSEVECWIQCCQSEQQQHAAFLLITGPSGCGKATTVRTLCRTHSIECKEWLNPVTAAHFDPDTSHFVKQADRFTDFVIQSSYSSFLSRSPYNLCIVREYPNVFLRNPDEFTNALSVIYECTNVVVVFIATDTDELSSNIERNLFPAAVKSQFKIETIAFNGASTTLTRTALKRAQQIIAADDAVYKLPSDAEVEAICASASGDLRSAMNTFYLASLKGAAETPLLVTTETLTKAGAKRKRPLKSYTLKMKGKDEMLGLFHSVGRVLCPKFEPTTHRFIHDFESLVEEFATQPNVHVAFVFENYIRHFGDVDDAAHAADYISRSQVCLQHWRDRHSSILFAMYMCVMGLVLHNRHKISMWNPIRGPVKIQYAPRIPNVSPLDLCYHNVITKTTPSTPYSIDL